MEENTKTSILKIAGSIIKSESEKCQKNMISEFENATKDYVYKTINTALYKVYKTSTDIAQLLIYRNTSNTRLRMMDIPSYNNSSIGKSNTASSSTTTTTKSNYTCVGSMSRPKSPFDFDSIIYPDRETAQMYLDDMQQHIGDYGELKVSQYFNMVGKDYSGNFTTQEYAWNNLDEATIEPTYGGNFIISLPIPNKIK